MQEENTVDSVKIYIFIVLFIDIYMGARSLVIIQALEGAGHSLYPTS